MTKARMIILLSMLMIGLAVADYQRPSEPTGIHEVTVLALRDDPQINGGRIIHVRFEDGGEKHIKTLTPFFYKAGYSAHVGAFERTFFPDIYDFIAE